MVFCALLMEASCVKVLSGAGAQIDTTTPNERLLLGIFATLAEFQRELIRERAHAGLAAARARERKGGRTRKMTRSTVLMAMAATADQKRECNPGGKGASNNNNNAVRLYQQKRLGKTARTVDIG